MSNRRFNQFRLQLEKKVVDLYAKVTIGATGAPTLVTAYSKGIASIARNSAGNYTVTLDDKYPRFLFMQNFHADADGIVPSPVMSLIAEDVDGLKTIQVVFSDTASPSATELGDGETVYLHITLANTDVF